MQHDFTALRGGILKQCDGDFSRHIGGVTYLGGGNDLQCKVSVFLPEINHGARLFGKVEDAFGTNSVSDAFLGNWHSIPVKEYRFMAGVGQFYKILSV